MTCFLSIPSAYGVLSLKYNNVLCPQTTVVLLAESPWNPVIKGRRFRSCSDYSVSLTCSSNTSFDRSPRHWIELTTICRRIAVRHHGRRSRSWEPVVNVDVSRRPEVWRLPDALVTPCHGADDFLRERGVSLQHTTVLFAAAHDESVSWLNWNSAESDRLSIELSSVVRSCNCSVFAVRLSSATVFGASKNRRAGNLRLRGLLSNARCRTRCCRRWRCQLLHQPTKFQHGGVVLDANSYLVFDDVWRSVIYRQHLVIKIWNVANCMQSIRERIVEIICF